jgi:ribosomal protein L22
MADEPKNDEAPESEANGTTEETPQAETPAKKPAAKKAAAKKATAKKATAKKAAAKKAPAAKTEPTEDAAPADAPETEATAKKPAAKQATAKPAAEKAEKAPAAEPKPAAAKKAAANGGRPTVRAHAKYVRTSARKAQLVCDHIRGKDVDDARAILAHTQRAVARDWSKLLESAVANAEHNHELVGEDLKILSVTADEGPTLKRFQPRAMGRATKIRKRTSHLTITLTPKD